MRRALGFWLMTVASTHTWAGTSVCQAQVYRGEGAPAFIFMSGELTAIDPAQQRVFVRGGASVEYAFTLHPEADIADGQRSIGLQELEPGDVVVIRYKEALGRRIAHNIVIERNA
jgi:hypothetical protein